MELTDYLLPICSADQEIRRDELLNILDTLDYTFAHHHDVVEKHRPENIVVSFNEGNSPRLVIGAHYDSTPGSTGANDNGAGVAILLGLLAHFKQAPPKIPLDIVFFDLEEQGSIGSQAYIERVSEQRILAMINLDICGEGDTILCAPRKHVEAGPLSLPLRAVEQTDRFRIRAVDLLPPGDDLSFERAGLPNVSVCILPAEDVEPLLTLIDDLSNHRQPGVLPKVVETMHSGPRDAVTTVQESAMQIILQWVEAVLERFPGQ